MAKSEAAQKGQDVNMHKRLAMGEKLNGQSLGAKGGSTGSAPKGALHGMKKK